MHTMYIVGRPLTVSGEKLEVGDQLTKAQLSKIPRLESWISTRHIYPVVSKRDADQLPGFLRRALKTKDEARAEYTKNRSTYFGGNEKAEKANAEGQDSSSMKRAKRDAKVQDLIYAAALKRRPVSIAVEDEEPTPVVDDPQPVSEAPEADSVIEATEFDPSGHSVAEVKDYLEQNPNEKENVLKAEAAGKARKGLLEAF